MTDSHTADAPSGRRSGGRAGRAAMRAASVIERVPYLTRTMQPFEILSEEALATIEYTADTVLEEVGIEVRDYPEALPMFASAGAAVDGTRVRFPRGMCREIVSNGRSNPVFHAQSSGPIFVRLEARGETIGCETRGINRLTEVHAVQGDIEKELQHSLCLHIATRCSECHHRSVLLHSNARIGREARPPSRTHAARMPLPREGLRSARGGTEPQAGNERRII